VTDRSAAQLGGLLALEILDLSDNARVGDVTLAALRRCKNLKDLKIVRTDCRAAGVQALQKALPELKITYP
jgi:hypothetical protein